MFTVMDANKYDGDIDEMLFSLRIEESQMPASTAK
jgi:hypothetical protein